MGLGPFVSPLELIKLTLSFLSGNPIPLLNLTNELVPLPLDNGPVIVGQTTPLFLGPSNELLPVSLNLVAVHGSKVSVFVNLALPTTSASFRFRHLWGAPVARANTCFESDLVKAK